MATSRRPRERYRPDGSDPEAPFPPPTQGDQGETGAKGDTGDTGPKGDTGDTGLKGDTGDTGLKGDTGDTGLKGDTGTAGAKGDTGAAGAETIAPLLRSGDYAQFRTAGSSTSTLTTPSTYLYVFPVWLGSALNTAEYQLEVLAAGGADFAARLLRFNHLNNWYGNQVADYGTVSLAVTGSKIWPIIETLPIGVHWLGVLISGSGTSPQMRAYASASGLLSATTAAAAQVGCVGFYKTNVLAAPGNGNTVAGLISLGTMPKITFKLA
jgi:hypothetical protein